MTAVPIESISQDRIWQEYDLLHSSLVRQFESLRKHYNLDGSCLSVFTTSREMLENKSLTVQQNLDAYKKLIIAVIKCIPEFTNQLDLYYRAWLLVFSKSDQVNMREKTNKYLSDIAEIVSMYDETRTMHNQNKELHNNYDNIVLYSMFYCHMIQVEKIETALKKDLEDYLKPHIDNSDKFDIEMMFSFGEKMPRILKSNKSEYVTHGKAIRDALAHKKFKIYEQEGRKYVRFANNEFGYNYAETFPIDDFIKYVHGSNTLYRLMLILQDIIIISALADHMIKTGIHVTDIGSRSNS